MAWPERPRVPAGRGRKNAFSGNPGLGDVSSASEAVALSREGTASRNVRPRKAVVEAKGVAGAERVGRGRRRDRNRMSYRLVAAVVVGGMGGFLGAEAASAGAAHSCVVLDDFTVKCWGENFKGQLGQGDVVTRGLLPGDMGDNLPTVPLGDFEAASVYSGEEFSCAVSVGGAAKCWGVNTHGQLGLGDSETRGDSVGPLEMGNNLASVNVGKERTVESMGLGSSHTCAILDGGDVKCWGLNEGGQLGLGDNVTRGNVLNQMGDNLPLVDLGEDVNASSISLGARHTCAVVNDGDVKCWGNNDGGQLGYESTSARGLGVTGGEMGDDLPVVNLGTGEKAIAVAVGSFHSCALLDTGSLKCWGFGQSGQLGQGSNASIGQAPGTMGDALSPIDLGEGRTAVAVAPGGTHTCAVLDDDTIKCWGGNTVGTLGQGDNRTRGTAPNELGDNLAPVKLTFGGGQGAVANAFAGTFHTCVLGTAGDLACFGLNFVGQLGAGSAEDSIGVEAGQTEAIEAVSLGDGVTIVAPASPASLITPEPSPAPSSTSETRAPVPVFHDGEVTPDEPPSNDAGAASAESGDGGGGGGSAAATATIVSAAILIPLIAVVAFVCCWRRRNRHRRDAKGVLAAGPSCGPAMAGGDRRAYGRGDSATSSENNADTHDSNGISVGALDGLDGKSRAPLLASSSAPIEGTLAMLGSDSVETVSASADGLPRPTAVEASTAAAATAAERAGTIAAAPVAIAIPMASAYSDDDDSSRCEASDVENPSELRRSGSNSSISTLGSTSTASSTWPSDGGFVTPARTDISRGGGRYGGRGRGHVVAGSGGVEGLSAGIRTPASLAAGTPNRAVPDTPSPRSVSSSVHGTPHPPEMRLAQFARKPAGGSGVSGVDTNLYGLPEMEVGRSSSTVFESGGGASSDWPTVNRAGSGSVAPASAASASAGGAASTTSAAAAAAAAATAAAAAAASAAYGDSPENSSPSSLVSPTMGPTLTPARFRHRHGETTHQQHGVVIGGAGEVDALGRQTASGKKSNRSSRTSASSPSPSGRMGGPGDGDGAGGMGAEAAAQAFTEEAELEALQIDKNDLKLVFGRPFARGKSSEVYQVTHQGKNRAAKIIDLFSLGVVGHEVTRLYACFAQELRAMKGIRHDCVAAVYGAVATPSELTIVTDLVKRGPLRALLDDKNKRESLTAATRHRIIKDVASGMAYLSDHGLQHRNLHSHNVLITKEWGAKVADYGLARTTGVMLGGHDSAHGGSSKKRTRSSYRAGTLRWTAPELLKPPADGTDPFTEASDVYSIGVIAWEVLCGGSKLPYDSLDDDKVKSMILEGSTPPVSMETPLAYNKLMLLCWRKNPSSRPSFAHISTVLLENPPPAKS